MKLLVKGNAVDLERPFQIEEEDIIKLDTFLKKTFGKDYEGIEEIKELSKEPPEEPQERKPRQWTKEELYELYIGEDDEQIATKLKRSAMSVRMKGADFCPAIDKILSESKVEHYNATSEEIIKSIQKYLKRFEK